MTTKYLVLSLKENAVLNEAYLTSTGIKTSDEYFVTGKHHGLFDTLNEATKYAEMILSCDAPEIGVEVKTVFVK